MNWAFSVIQAITKGQNVDICCLHGNVATYPKDEKGSRGSPGAVCKKPDRTIYLPVKGSQAGNGHSKSLCLW